MTRLCNRLLLWTGLFLYATVLSAQDASVTFAPDAQAAPAPSGAAGPADDTAALAKATQNPLPA